MENLYQPGGPCTFTMLPCDVVGLVWDALPCEGASTKWDPGTRKFSKLTVDVYPDVRFVCGSWYREWKRRRARKLLTVPRLIQVPMRYGVAAVPVLPNNHRHGRLSAQSGERPYYFCDYYDNEKDGDEVYLYRRTQQVDVKCSYRRGRKHGEYLRFSILGTLLEYTTYLNGLVHGHSRRFDPVSGACRMDTQFYRGRMHGVKRTWRWDDGSPNADQWFVMGIPVAGPAEFIEKSAALPRPLD
jgi:hypothetical protein